MNEARVRHGFTLIPVLWVMAMASVATAGAVIAGRNVVGAARNRVEWERSYWRTLGCQRRVQALAERAVAWRGLPTVIDTASMVAGCQLAFDAAGSRIDVNAATEEMLSCALRSVAGDIEAPALARRIAAARDTLQFADLGELAGIAGLDDRLLLDSLLSTEPGRVALSAASAGVLECVPGITPEIAAVIVARREAGQSLSSLSDVLGIVSRASASELELHYQEAARLTTPDPDAWVVRASWRSPSVATRAVLEWRLVRAANGVVVARASAR